MASKSINIALFLTINLVFFGFTMAQDPGPQAPTCPRSPTQLDDCATRLAASSFLQRQCCNLVDGLDPSVASVCICDAVKIIGEAGLALPVLRSCLISPPAGFRCP